MCAWRKTIFHLSSVNFKGQVIQEGIMWRFSGNRTTGHCGLEASDHVVFHHLCGKMAGSKMFAVTQISLSRNEFFLGNFV